MIQTISDLIDTRSFSSLWYWIAVVVFWSRAGQSVLGVPWDLVLRARYESGDAEADLRDVIRVGVERLLRMWATSGLVMTTLVCFLLSALFGLGFLQGLELAQAVFLLAFPASLLFLLSLRTARRIHAADGDGLHAKLRRHRLAVQGLAAISILITAGWGMWQNLIRGFF